MNGADGSDRKLRYFQLAAKCAQKSQYKYKLGCVIVKKSRIIGIGFNKCHTHPHSPTPYKTIHAEIDALLGNDYKDLQGASAFVVRLRNNGSYALAKPCQHCFELLKKCGLKQVFWTTNGSYETANLKT